MQTLYKWVDGILEEQSIDMVDVDGWILFGWSPIVPEQPIEPESPSRKRSPVNASTTAAA